MLSSNLPQGIHGSTFWNGSRKHLQCFKVQSSSLRFETVHWRSENLVLWCLALSTCVVAGALYKWLVYIRTFSFDWSQTLCYLDWPPERLTLGSFDILSRAWKQPCISLYLIRSGAGASHLVFHFTPCGTLLALKELITDSFLYAFWFKAAFKAAVAISQANCKSEDSRDAGRHDKQIARNNHTSFWACVSAIASFPPFMFGQEERRWITFPFPHKTQRMLSDELKKKLIQPHPGSGYVSWCNYDAFMGSLCFLFCLKVDALEVTKYCWNWTIWLKQFFFFFMLHFETSGTF